MQDVWKKPIETLELRLEQEFGAFVRLAGELECVFFGETMPDDTFWQGVMDSAAESGIVLESIGKESENGQYEFRLKPTSAWPAACQIRQMRDAVNQMARSSGYECSFAAMPEGVSFSSGLHMHLHLVNHQEQYVFAKKEDEMSAPLKDSLGGLMATMCDFMLCFAPNRNSYARLKSGSDYVPQTVSWGGNNRTVALRLPESVVPWRHIEHRVSGADADPFAVTWALLAGVHYGLTHKPDPGPQMYGIASNPTYGLKRLPASVQEAEIAYSGSELVPKYGNEDIRRVLFAADAISQSGAA